MLIFDIETGPLPEDRLKELYQEPTFEQFAADCDQRWKPETKQAKFEEHVAGAWAKFVERAALSPITGQVLAIGLMNSENGKKAILDCGEDEAAGLQSFWKKYLASRTAGRSLVGFNIAGFDVPFLVRRSWFLGVAVPASIFDATGRYLDHLFVDLLARWRCGNFQESIKLADLARAMGCGDKPEGVTGADFHRLWKTDRDRAIDYLTNDLEMTAKCAAKMGVA